MRQTLRSARLVQSFSTRSLESFLLNIRADESPPVEAGRSSCGRRSPPRGTFKQKSDFEQSWKEVAHSLFAMVLEQIELVTVRRFQDLLRVLRRDCEILNLFRCHQNSEAEMSRVSALFTKPGFNLFVRSKVDLIGDKIMEKVELKGDKKVP